MHATLLICVYRHVSGILLARVYEGFFPLKTIEVTHAWHIPGL